jgi:hypothetical protein
VIDFVVLVLALATTAYEGPDRDVPDSFLDGATLHGPSLWHCGAQAHLVIESERGAFIEPHDPVVAQCDLWVTYLRSGSLLAILVQRQYADKSSCSDWLLLCDGGARAPHCSKPIVSPAYSCGHGLDLYSARLRGDRPERARVLQDGSILFDGRRFSVRR